MNQTDWQQTECWCCSTDLSPRRSLSLWTDLSTVAQKGDTNKQTGIKYYNTFFLMKCLGVLLWTWCSTCSVTSLLCWFGSTMSEHTGFCFLVSNGDSFSVLPYGVKYQWINTLTHMCKQTSVSTCWGGSRSCRFCKARSLSCSGVSARLLLSAAKT